MLRGFTDSAGTEWRVWEVVPNAATSRTAADTLSHSSLKETPFVNGWLCFECDNRKRRLAPIPSGWEFRESTWLEEQCARATEVPLRRQSGGSGLTGVA